MAELVGGAVLGLAFTELWDQVKKLKDGVKDFKPQLRSLEETLQMLDPMIQDIKRINSELEDSDRTEVERLNSMMEEGKELVRKCVGVSRFNFTKKSRYQKKLVELDNDIIRFNIKHTQLGTFREVKRLRLEMRSGFEKISNQMEGIISCTKQDEAGRNGMPPSTAAGAVAEATTDCQLQPSPIDLHNPNPNPTDVQPPKDPIDVFYDVKESAFPLVRPLPTALPPPPVARAPTTIVPTVVPRAPSIGVIGLIILILVPSENVILKITAIFIIICKAMKTVVCRLERSENGVWMVIKDVGMLETTIGQLDATMESLEHVLEEIESNNGERVVMMNEGDRREAAGNLRSLLGEGEKLISETSNISWWNFVKKWQYQKKMVELDNKLLRFHSLYLQARLARNDEKTNDDSEMNEDDESSEPAHYGEDRDEMRGRHMHTRENESYDMLNNNVNHYQYLDYNPPISGSMIGGFHQYALGIEDPHIMEVRHMNLQSEYESYNARRCSTI